MFKKISKFSSQSYNYLIFELNLEKNFLKNWIEILFKLKSKIRFLKVSLDFTSKKVKKLKFLNWINNLLSQIHLIKKINYFI